MDTDTNVTDNLTDVPSTRETLGGHLYQKVNELLEGKDASPCQLQKLTGMLMECDTTDILLLLRDNQHLQARLAAALRTLSSADSVNDNGVALHTDFDPREDLGVQLFAQVSEIESGLCAQITGMLLELDPGGVELLLKDKGKLQRAVEKAKSTFLKHHNYELSVSDQSHHGGGALVHERGKPTEPDTEDVLDMGERLYVTVAAVYPEYAGQITGMLLEMGPKTLKQLMQNDQLLWRKIDIAREVINQQDRHS